MKKQFYAYNNKEEALKYWSKEELDNGKKTTKDINVVEDSTVCNQKIKEVITTTRIELKNAIIVY